jgi:low affinity Fe/Cu permease
MKFEQMKSKSYIKSEAIFEKLSEFTIKTIGHPYSFIFACILVLYWLIASDFNELTLHDFIRDVILSITFLCFFLIQKTVNKYSKALHLKLNELVSAHENASDAIVNIEAKTEKELHELSKNYSSGKVVK